MRNCCIVLLAIMLFGLSTGLQAKEETKLTLENEAQKISYALGNDIGQKLKGFEFELDLAILQKAIEHSYKGIEGPLTDKEAAEILQNFFKEMQAKQQEKRNEMGEKNKKAGEEFLAQNKEKKGVKVTDSGLQYEVVTEGKGGKPAATDKVKVHYKGTLIDGTEFDSSYSRNQPAEFKLNGVIRGWTEGVQLMTVGSKYKFYVPANLAYGERGAGAKIAPNATLIFEIELLDIIKE